MENVEIKYVLVCDDVRREDNGKEILIGVYSSDIQTTVFPSNLALVFWMELVTKKPGRHRIDIRVIGPNNTHLVQGTGELQGLHEEIIGSLALGPLSMQIQSEGEIRLELREPRGEWLEVKRIPVRLRASPA